MCTRDRIIRYAKGAIGCAYDWTPSGGVEGESYNCSYLTFCAYRYAGLEIPTWQGHQNGNGSQSDWVRWNNNLTTNPNKLEPGDLVFFSVFGDIEDTYHVGISLGGTRIIDSMPTGGVQERELYDTFVGGGWPLEKKKEKIMRNMCGFIEVADTLIFFDGNELHDVSEPECIEPLNKLATAFSGSPLPTIKLSDEEYARVCEVLRAGMPVHLYDLNCMYNPR